MADAAQGSPADRRRGLAPNGDVELRDYDLAVVAQLGAILGKNPSGDDCYIIPKSVRTVARVAPPPGFPGIPVYFWDGEDAYQRYVQPYVMLRRDSIADAPNRVQMGLVRYVVPDPSASVTSSVVGSRGETAVGPTRRLARSQAAPHDITYSAVASASKRALSQILWRHVMICFPQYGYISVVDSVGDVRSYDCYRESIDIGDDVFDVGDRSMGMTVAFRVEGELDFSEETTRVVASSPLTSRVTAR